MSTVAQKRRAEIVYFERSMGFGDRLSFVMKLE